MFVIFVMFCYVLLCFFVFKHVFHFGPFSAPFWSRLGSLFGAQVGRSPHLVNRHLLLLKKGSRETPR